jgi:hypothetical protein
VRQLQPQIDHGVDEDQLVIGSGTSRPLTFAPASFPERGFAPRRPRTSQLLDQIAEMCTVKATEGGLGHDRAGGEGRHNPLNPRDHRHVTAGPAPPGNTLLGS